jgi:hypothetical protein
MDTVNGQMVSTQQMADLLETAKETKSVKAGELTARWLETPVGSVILIQGMSEGLLFSGR